MKTLFVLLATTCASAAMAASGDLPSVTAHPIFKQPYSCTEHWLGNLKGEGDALGTDCVIQQMVEVKGRTWMRSHKGDGSRNTDWYGWGKEVLSPCTCEVVDAQEHPSPNKPGIMGKPPAGMVKLKRDDGVFFLLGHVTSLTVKAGDKVESGQVVGRVGNNGYSRHPHIHMGAWKDKEPLQIRFDLAAMGRLFED